MTANPIFWVQTKHMELDFHFVRDKVASKQLTIKFISSKDQLANTFTKTLSASRLALLGDNLNVASLSLSLRRRIKTQFDQLSLDNNQQQKREYHGKRGRDKAEQNNHGEDIRYSLFSLINLFCNSRCAVSFYFTKITINLVTNLLIISINITQIVSPNSEAKIFFNCLSIINWIRGIFLNQV